MVGGNIGAFICMTFTLPLVAFFGEGNEQKGFSYTLAFLFFTNVRETKLSIGEYGAQME